ncbi:hypothetical protein GCM10023166_37510 [Paeniglutamicibacter cryotolerans]
MAVLPRPGMVALPDVQPPFKASATIRDMRMRFEDLPDGRLVIWLQAPRLQVVLEVAPGDESLGVVVPWAENRVQYTVQEPGHAASGTLAGARVPPSDSRARAGGWPTPGGTRGPPRCGGATPRR